MTLYELWLVLHVAAAIIWLGAGFTLTLLMLGAERSRDAAEKAALNARTDWLAPRLFIPASLATLIFGVLLVIEGPWGFDYLWVALGLAGWLVSFGIGILYFKPEGERVAALVEQHGAQGVEVQRRLALLEAVGRAEITLLFVIVADMLVKPTADDIGFLVGAALALCLGAVLAMLALRDATAGLARS